VIEITVVVNPASAVGQSATREEVERRLVEAVDCLKSLQSRFNAGTAARLFDSRTEHLSLGLDEPIIASLNHLRNKDVARSWFLYTRNRVRLVSVDSQTYSVVAGLSERAVELSTELVRDATHWISFEGAGFPCGEISVINTATSATVTMANAERVETARKWTPRYEASPKHGVLEYQSASGLVSAMDLSEDDANRALAQSLGAADGRRYVRFRGRLYCFRYTRTDNGQEVFHGYLITEEEVPAEIYAVVPPG
jgi:hypothetical protein